MPEEPCPGQTCVPARVRMPVELMTAAGVGAGDSAGAGDGAGTGGERGAGGAAVGGQAAPPPAELAAALWSLANGLLHYGRDLVRVAIPLPHAVTNAAALYLVHRVSHTPRPPVPTPSPTPAPSTAPTPTAAMSCTGMRTRAGTQVWPGHGSPGMLLAMEA